ncbi:MAG: phosphate ABC transporter substrate-binding protein PstS [Thermodesulfobacteriota bacterium]
MNFARYLRATVLIALIAFVAATDVFAGDVINGAGASFPYPLYSKWAYEYNKATGVKLNYQSIGSGGGIKQIKAKTVDFGASDAPLKAEDLKKSGLTQFPMAIGGVVPVVNVKGVGPGGLRLTPDVLAGIFLGEITRWNDDRIKAINNGLRLPSKKITVVHRSDGSGTSWIFTNYLDKVSPEWRDRVGYGKAVKWPVGIGGKGNEGVANFVKRVKNSIGYVEYAYATQNRLAYAKLRNRDGNYAAPSIESFMAAAAGADWKNTPGYSVVLTDQPGAGTWPIAGATFILVYKKPGNCETAGDVLKFFNWAYRNGAEMAVSLDYVPIPEDVYSIMEANWAKAIRCDDRHVWNR